MVVAGSTHISYVVGKGVSRVKNYTQVLDCISRGNRISEKLSREFIYEGLSGLSITYYNKFSFLGIEFQFHASHPVLDTCETLCKLSETGIKIPIVQC